LKTIKTSIKKSNRVIERSFLLIMYVNWLRRTHYHIENSVYVYLDDVMKLLQLARLIQNIEIDKCPRIRHMICNIHCFQIRIDKRAPEKSFVIISNSDLADLFNQINYASEGFEKNQSCEYIKNLYNIILQKLSDFCSYCIYTRQSFETQMDLQWFKVEDISTN